LFSYERVTDAATVNGPTREALTRIHEAAFPPEERYWPFARLFDMAGKDGVELFILTRDGEAAGYISLQLVAADNVAYLWYLATAPDVRNVGLGAFGVRAVLTWLEMSAAPPVAAFFDARAPEPRDAGDPRSYRNRRLRWYRDLGAYWLKGLDYMAAAATEGGDDYPCYILFFPVTRMPTAEEIRTGALAVAGYFYERGDARLESLVRSFDGMEVIAPR